MFSRKTFNKNKVECNYEDIKSDSLEVTSIYLNKPKKKSNANIKIVILMKVKFESNDRKHTKKSMKQSVWVIKINGETYKHIYSLKGFRLANYDFEKKT